MEDHSLFAHQLEAARKAKERADLEVTGGHIIRAGYKRRPRDHEQVKPRAGGRLTGIDWWAPSPLVDFERNTTNYRIPTLLLTPVSKVAVPRGPAGETHPDYPDPESAVVDHYGYIERQERAQRTALQHGDYIERDDARDISELGDVSHIATNIDRNPEKRKEFARAVYRHERLGEKHYLTARLDDLDWWEGLAVRPDAPAWVKQVANSLRRNARKAATKSQAYQRKYVRVVEVDERAAYDRILWCEGQPGWDAKQQQIAFQSGPGGRVQYRFVFQLPYWISAQERLQIVRKMARHLGDLGFMYVAAIHRPDPHNDPRNFHVHIDAYDRPCKFIKELGVWDFEVSERKRNGSVRFPLRQNKIEGFARSTDGTWRGAHGADVVTAMRQKFCDFTNAVLEGSSSPLRYHPGPFAEIGLNLRATAKLGGALMASEANGVRTGVGDNNADAIWSDVFDGIYRQHQEAVACIWERSREISTKIAYVIDRGERHQLEQELATHRRGELELAERLFRFHLANAEIRMMKSRAETVIREAGRRGVGRSEQKAYRNSSLGPLRDFAVQEAEVHLALVDTHAPSQEAVANELHTVAQREQALAAQRCALETVVEECLTSEPAVPADIERVSPTIVRLPLPGNADAAQPPLKVRPYEGLEVGRLLAWFREHGNELARFDLDGTHLTVKAPQAVCSRLAKHCDKPAIQEQINEVARELAHSRTAELQTAQANPTNNKREGEALLRSLTRGPGSANAGAVRLAREAARSTISSVTPPENHRDVPEVSRPAAEPDKGPEGTDVELDHVPIYIQVDREFVEEEMAAGRAVDGNLLRFFRLAMAGDTTPFYTSMETARMYDALLVPDYAPGIALVVPKLEAAADDEQVTRYIRRMIPTLTAISESEPDMVSLPISLNADDHHDLLARSRFMAARAGRSFP